MSEWSSHINPFNSLKALLWSHQFEVLVKGEIPEPVSVTVDPTNRCNLNCEWCHYSSWRAENPAHAHPDALIGLAYEIVRWHQNGGPGAVCVAGGGEPLLHEAAPELIKILVDGGLQVGMITNGVNLRGPYLEAAKLCRWVGFSVDAGTAESYAKYKGTSKETFNRVLEHITLLASYNPRPSIGFKFLLQPDTIGELVKAARLAKKCGADDFHARPIYIPDLRWRDSQISAAIHYIEKARYILEDDRFHIYGVTHKFAPDFGRVLPKRCEVTPLAGLTFTADHQCYICCDKRGDEDGRMCAWQDIRSFWGSEGHKEVLRALDTSKCHRRCTFSGYQEILEKVFREDEMCRAFI